MTVSCPYCGSTNVTEDFVVDDDNDLPAVETGTQVYDCGGCLGKFPETAADVNESSDEDALDLRILGIDVEDDEARDLANRLFRVLHDAGYDVDGVAPVLRDDGLAPVFRDDGGRSA